MSTQDGLDCIMGNGPAKLRRKANYDNKISVKVSTDSSTNFRFCRSCNPFISSPVAFYFYFFFIYYHFFHTSIFVVFFFHTIFFHSFFLFSYLPENNNNHNLCSRLKRFVGLNFFF